MSPDRFWSLSLRELWNEHEAAAKRAKREYERDLVLAWQIGRIEIMSMQPDGGRKLPNLKNLLSDTGSKRQTREEQFAVMHAMSAAYGIGIQKLRKGPDGQYRRID